MGSPRLIISDSPNVLLYFAHCVRPDKAAEWESVRMERILSVHQVKLVGPGLSSISPQRRRKARIGKDCDSDRYMGK